MLPEVSLLLLAIPAVVVITAALLTVVAPVLVTDAVKVTPLLTTVVTKAVITGNVDTATGEVVTNMDTVALGVVDGGAIVDWLRVVEGVFVTCGVVETSVDEVETGVVEVGVEDELDEAEADSEAEAEVEADALAELPVPIGTLWLLACRIPRSLSAAEVKESTASSAAKRYAKASLLNIV